MVAIPVGTIVRVLNKGAGLLTISAVTPGTTTVTSTGVATAAPTVKANGAVNLTQIAADTWAVSGDVDAQVLTNKTLTSPVINTPTGIVKGDVGLGNVDNTSDVTKNAATVTLTNKTLTSPVINAPTGIVKGDVGLGSVDNTSDVTKNAATVALTNKTLTSPVINAPTGLVKGDVGLGSVDNTSDATKNAAAVALANKDLTAVTNTFPASLATLTGTQTVTGKTMAYGSNTFTGFPSSAPWTSSAISTNTTLVARTQYFVTTSSAWTLTLPASPVQGDEIRIFDASGSAATNNITVAPNGLNFQGSVQNLVLAYAYVSVTLIYTGATYGWKVA